MSSLEIKVNVRVLEDYSKKFFDKIEKKTLLKIIKAFSEYLLELYGSLIEEAVNSNRYKGQWEPVDDEGYKEYLGTEPTGDILYYIKDALEVKKIGYNFIIRIDPKKKYPGSNLSVERVVLALDNGTLKFSARPILKKIIRQIRSHIKELFRGFLKMKGAI